MASYIDLGAYRKYSVDPRLSADGDVIAGQDRASDPHPFHTQAAIRVGGAGGVWDPLPDPATQSPWSIGHFGTADRVVGYMVPEGQQYNSLAALWTKPAAAWVLTVLPMPVNAVMAIAYDVDAAGTTIVGSVRDTSDVFHAAVWRQSIPGDPLSWEIELLPSGAGGAEAYGIDAAKRVVGTLWNPQSRAMRWEFAGGVWTPVDLYPTGPARVTAHNDGLVVGAFVDGGYGRACAWDAAGTFIDLGGSAHSEAWDHHSGVVVGVDYIPGDSPSGWVALARRWTAAEPWHDIHPPADGDGPWTWSWATGVDAAGNIVGVRGRGGVTDPLASHRQLYFRTPR